MADDAEHHAGNAGNASFHTLDFVRSLLGAFCDALMVRPAQNPSQFVGAQSSSAFVQDNLLFCEASPLWNDGQHADGLRNVREMVARALGITIEDYDMDLPNSILVDLVVDTLALAVRRSFSELQVQQLLLLLVRTHRDVVDIRCQAEAHEEDAQTDEHVIEGVVARRLTKRLIDLTSSVATPCIEKRTIREVSHEERVDPAALAALESKRDPKANKKQQAVYDEALRNLPKVMVEVATLKDVECEVVVDIGPVFSYDDVGHICNHIAETLLAHWRLYRYCATQERACDVRRVDVVISDAPVFSIPPLSAALPEREHNALCAREAFWNSCVATVEQSFETLFAAPMRTLDTVVQGQLREQLAASQREERADRDAALSLDEFEKTVEVLKRRVAKRVQHNPDTALEAPKQAQVSKGPASAAADIRAAAVSPPRSASVCSNNAMEAALEIPDHFDFNDVDLRLQALSDALTRSAAAAAPTKGKR